MNLGTNLNLKLNTVTYRVLECQAYCSTLRLWFLYIIIPDVAYLTSHMQCYLPGLKI